MILGAYLLRYLDVLTAAWYFVMFYSVLSITQDWATHHESWPGS
jgi:hypothetical protein